MGRYKSGYTCYIISISTLMGWKYHLPRSYIEAGTHYSTRGGCSWDCGPNSAGRALQMWEKNPRDFSNYSSFRNRCPKLAGSPNTTAGKTWNVITGILTFGVSAIITGSIPDVGPTPSMLAGYITDRISGIGRACYEKYSCFSTALKKIKIDLNMGDPVIALIAWSPTSMHYINVVGVSETNQIACIDTDNALEYYSEDDFEDLMDCSSYQPHSWCLDYYNLIRFEKY